MLDFAIVEFSQQLKLAGKASWESFWSGKMPVEEKSRRSLPAKKLVGKASCVGFGQCWT